MIFSNIIVSNPYKAGRVSEKVSIHTGKRKAPSAQEQKHYQPWMEGTPINRQRNRKEIKIFRTGQSGLFKPSQTRWREPRGAVKTSILCYIKVIFSGLRRLTSTTKSPSGGLKSRLIPPPPTTYLCYPHMPCPFACSCSIMCAPVSVRGCPCRCPLPLGGLTLHRDFDKVLIK